MAAAKVVREEMYGRDEKIKGTITMFLTGLRSAWQRRDLGGHFPKKNRGVEVSPPDTSLLSGELLVEQGFVVPLLILSHSHGSISCAPQGCFTTES